jgi:hypothetical protein
MSETIEQRITEIEDHWDFENANEHSSRHVKDMNWLVSELKQARAINVEADVAIDLTRRILDKLDKGWLVVGIRDAARLAIKDYDAAKEAT